MLFEDPIKICIVFFFMKRSFKNVLSFQKYKVLALGYPGALNWLGGVYGKDWGGGSDVPQWGHQMYSTPLTEFPKRGADELIPRLSYFGE